jgi:DNA-binding MurR/RpiR family transcriptional regulator
VATTTGGRNATLSERLAAREDQLSRAEQSVARYMAENPQEVAFASAEELGQLTGTSDATVIRTVKALGYAGLPTLKRSLQASLREHLTPAGRLTHRLESFEADGEHLLDLVIGEQIRLLEAARRTILHEEFAAAVAALQEANHILVAAIGMHGRLAEHFTTRLVRQGRDARSTFASGFLLADALVSLQSGDVVLLICSGQVKPEDEVVIEHAGKVGAKIILITDTLREALGDRIDVTLCAEASQRERISFITVTLTIMEAIVLALAAEDRPRASESMERLVEIRDRLVENIASEVNSGRMRPNRRRPRQVRGDDQPALQP